MNICKTLSFYSLSPGLNLLCALIASSVFSAFVYLITMSKLDQPPKICRSLILQPFRSIFTAHVCLKV